MILTLALGANLTVTLPDETKVSGAEMKLGDVAVVEGEDQELVQRAKDLVLGYAPAPGYHRTLRQWKLGQDLAEALPGVEVEFEGSSVMRIFPETATILASELEGAAHKAVADYLEGQEIRVSLRGSLHDQLVPLGENSRRLEVDLDGRRRDAGTWSVPVRILVDDVRYTTVWVPLQVEIFRELPVLKRDVPAGRELTAADYSIERVLVQTGLAAKPLDGAPEIGAIAARSLIAGNVLMENDLKYALFVERDSIAKLTARNRSVQVNVMVVVLEDGRMGDRVRVRSLSGDKEVTARVTGKGTLEFNLQTDGPVTRR